MMVPFWVAVGALWVGMIVGAVLGISGFKSGMKRAGF
jgi:hypothetical protein